MSRHDLDELAERLLARVEELVAEVGLPQEANPEAFDRLREDVLQAVEELHVAGEELRQQNEELAAARDAVEHERTRYQDLFAFAPDGYLVTDARGIIREANRAAAGLLGVRQDRLAGKPLASFAAPADESEFRYGLANSVRAAPDAAPARWRTRLGPWGDEPVPVAVTVAAVRDGEGQVTGLRWLLRDVTGETRLQRDLEAREAQFRLLFEEMVAGVGVHEIVLDEAGAPVDYRFLDVNPAFERFTGLARNRVVGRTVREVLPGIEEEWIRRFGRVALTGEPDRFESHAAELGRWYGVSAFRTEPGRFAVTFTDVTESRRAEQALRESEARFRGTFENAPVGLAHVEPGGTFLRVNSAFCDIVGRSREELSTMRFRDITHPEDLGADLEQAARLFRGEIDRFSLDKRYLRPDGETVWARLTASVQRDEDGVIRYAIAAVEDIGERVRAADELRRVAAAAEAAGRAKAEFLANMSHEIRTPLSGVIGMTGLLQHTALDREQRDYVETIRASGDLLLSIVNDILDFSKIEAGGLVLERTPFDLGPTVEETVHMLGEHAHRKGLELACWIDDDVPARILGDAGRLQQVLLNLVGNAVKFTETGEVVVRAGTVEKGGRTAIRVEVRDTGVGIAPEAQVTLFDSFTQADASSRRRAGGTGLGLAIVKRLVEAMGGTVGVESRMGRGSTFWFTVPAELPPEAGVLSPPSGDDALLPGLRALVADDSPTTREFLRRQLERLGVTAEAVPDAAAALREARAAVAGGRAYHLVLADLELAGGDDLSWIGELHGKPRPGATPVVLLAPFTRRSEAADACRNGVAAYLVKPVRQTALAGLLWALTHPDAEPDAADAFRELPADLGLTGGARVLLAEDNEVNQKVVAGLLGKLGCRVDVVASGDQAVEAALRSTYDAVLMDWQMPGMDGLEATREIRRRERGQRRNVIVALTANALAADRDRCLAAGMDDYLAKPLTLAGLGRTLQRWVGGRPTPGCATPAPPPEPPSRPENGGGGEQARQRVRRLLDALGAETLWKIVGLFLESGPEAIARLRELLETGQLEPLSREAHRFKGSCSQFGSDRLIDLCKDLELRAKEEATEQAATALDELEQEFARVRTALEAERAGA